MSQHRKAHYLFKPAVLGGYTISDSEGKLLSRLMWQRQMGQEGKIEENKLKGTYTLDTGDVPALPDEDWMPPMNTLRWRVKFYYTWATSAQDFWQGT